MADGAQNSPDSQDRQINRRDFLKLGVFTLAVPGLYLALERGAKYCLLNLEQVLSGIRTISQTRESSAKSENPTYKPIDKIIIESVKNFEISGKRAFFKRAHDFMPWPEYQKALEKLQVNSY